MAYTIEDLTRGIIATFKSYEKTGTLKWDYQIAARDLTYQIGSLTKLLMQLHNERFADKMSREEIMAKVADELADIMTDTVFIAHELGIDLNKAFDAMLASDQKKVAERTTRN